jgi:ketosteroid isomerase-like protein
MSQENVEVVRRIYEALNRRDWDAVFQDAHPDFEMTMQRGPNAGTHQGREDAQEVVEDYIEAFDHFSTEPETFHESGDQVVVVVKRRGRPKGGAVDMVIRNGDLFTVRDGKIVSMRMFPDPNWALEAVGLSD